ncbi:MAG: DUF4124 domain-containing protein [Desulfobacteraceae bacterium]|nr:DUF4124 domain-containing protein [Desulfobacteraceae bacterium]
MNRKNAFIFGQIILFAIVLGLLGNPNASADIYRWKDADGKWHFTDSPPSEEQVERLGSEIIQETSPPPQSNDKPLVQDQKLPDKNPLPSNSAFSSASGKNGLFWKISKNGLRPSYLLGTIHSSDPRVTQLRSEVQQALDTSDAFVMEMLLDTSVFMQLGNNIMLNGGKSLDQLLGQPLFQRVVNAVAGYGLPEMVTMQLKPWFIMALLSMPKPTGGQVLDMVLFQRAKSRGKPATGLETAQEQMAVFESIPLDDQISLLKMTLDQLPQLPGMFEALIQAYVADDLEKIEKLADQYKNQSDISALKRFMFKLNDERNTRMAVRMTSYLQQGNTFIAVGALHLAGNSGLLQSLRQNGYVLTPVR